MPVATAPATEMCGSDAMAPSAHPRDSSSRASAAYRHPAGTEATRRSASISSSPGSAATDTMRSSLSASRVKLCREPIARTADAPPTRSVSSAIVDGSANRGAANATLPAQLRPAGVRSGTVASEGVTPAMLGGIDGVDGRDHATGVRSSMPQAWP